MKSSIKRAVLWVALSTFTLLFIVPLQAQEVPDHLTETNTTVRDHRTKNTTITDGTSNVVLLGENNTFVGTRTAILEKYPSFKFTDKVFT